MLQIQEQAGSSSDSMCGRIVSPLSLSSPPLSTSEIRFSSWGPDITLATVHQESLAHCQFHPEEVSLLRGNVAKKRWNEFMLGRAAARLALIAAGVKNPGPVLRGSGREPVWPRGIVGSITHCGPWAVAAVAGNEAVEGLGIDLEDAYADPFEEIAGLICSDSERRWVVANGEHLPKLAMIFSAKEAIYKALYPLCKKFLDFQEVELSWFPHSSQFRGILLVDLSPEFRKGYCFEIGCQMQATFVFTRATIYKRAVASKDVKDFIGL
jgi:4'-phosphopantetheinyl transferase EntD